MIKKPFIQISNTVIHNKDKRGYLDILYEDEGCVLKQSFSKAGVFRGMHWQRKPYSQIKIIRVISGKILDFVMDVSKSPIQISYQELKSKDGWILVDAHLAHGFYAIEDTHFEYLCIGEYNVKFEESYSIINFLKVNFGILNPILSEKDRAAIPVSVISNNTNVKIKGIN